MRVFTETYEEQTMTDQQSILRSLTVDVSRRYRADHLKELIVVNETMSEDTRVEENRSGVEETSNT